MRVCRASRPFFCSILPKARSRRQTHLPQAGMGPQAEGRFLVLGPVPEPVLVDWIVRQRAVLGQVFENLSAGGFGYWRAFVGKRQTGSIASVDIPTRHLSSGPFLAFSSPEILTFTKTLSGSWLMCKELQRRLRESVGEALLRLRRLEEVAPRAIPRHRLLIAGADAYALHFQLGDAVLMRALLSIFTVCLWDGREHVARWAGGPHGPNHHRGCMRSASVPTSKTLHSEDAHSKSALHKK